MKDYWVKCKAWWVEQSPREQQVITWGGIVLAVIFVYACLWSPLTNQVATLRHEVKNLGKTLLWMRSADKHIQKIAAAGNQDMHAITPVQLLSVLQKRVQQTGLSKQVTELKQLSADGIGMHFQKVSFDELVVFLTSLVKAYTVTIAQMSVISENQPGIVSVDLTFQSHG